MQPKRALAGRNLFCISFCEFVRLVETSRMRENVIYTDMDVEGYECQIHTFFIIIIYVLDILFMFSALISLSWRGRPCKELKTSGQLSCSNRDGREISCNNQNW